MVRSTLQRRSGERIIGEKGKRNEERFEEECRTAVQEKNNRRKITLQRTTRSSKETYLEHRRRANKICRERKERC
jgi:hypothetical protein